MRIKALLNRRTRRQDVSLTICEEERRKWLTVPYVEGISDDFTRVVRDLNVRLSFFSLNKLKKFIKVQKDVLPAQSNKNVVYKISCRECDATYVGQTKRQLKTRISEHRSHINRITSTQSVVTEHRQNLDHDFDWENVEILDKEKYLSRRLISEMIHIKLQENSINLQNDTDFLHHAYMTILNKL
ncbi:uncharacterized protein [Temnothorax longispinosus]|uniref:uncharacterized protein n=1 Tax=Temnothorax longispinosus TaxID=300112 RepID=UPI003A98FD3E